MSNYRYEVDALNAIRIWEASALEGEAPFMLQPEFPDTTPWKDKAQAKEWAELFIGAMDNPESEFVAGDGPAEIKKPRPVEQPEVVVEEPIA